MIERYGDRERWIYGPERLLSLVWKQAKLVDGSGQLIPDAELVAMYLKIYQQSPHALPGAPKPDDRSRFAAVTQIDPFDWFRLNKGLPMQEIDPKLGFWVYDPVVKKMCNSFRSYIERFYRSWYWDNWAIGITPMALWMVNGEKVFARSFQLDMEVGPGQAKAVIAELQTRSEGEAHGRLVKSSENGSHYYGKGYYSYTCEGLVRLAGLFGCALLTNREGKSRNVDERSIGHQLRSFGENWTPDSENSEVGCLRVTRSLLKPDQPVIMK